MLRKYITIPNTLWKNIHQTGSSYICNPPVENTDIDFVIYTDNKELLPWLIEQGFETNNGDYLLEIDGLFMSFRKDKLNLIITDTYDFYVKFVEATKLAKKLNLLEKEQRIALFQYILYDLLR